MCKACLRKVKIIEMAGTEEAFTKNKASFLLVLEVQVQGSNKVGIILKLLGVCWQLPFDYMHM